MKKLIILIMMILLCSPLLFAEQIIISDGGSNIGVYLDNVGGVAGGGLAWIFSAQTFSTNFRMNITSIDVYISSVLYSGNNSMQVGLGDFSITSNSNTFQNWTINKTPSPVGWNTLVMNTPYLTARGENMVVIFKGATNQSPTEYDGRTASSGYGTRYIWHNLISQWSPQGNSLNLKINYTPCIEWWNESQTECLNTDEILKYYVDLNDCGTYVDLPIDNSSVLSSCNYCNSTYSSNITSCQIDDTISTNYDYTNSCCAETGLPSDCNAPENFTVSCNYCSGSYTSVIDGCLKTYDWNNYETCCAVTGLEDDCSIPENVTSCVGIHSTNEITGLVIDFGVEWGLTMISLVGVIALIGLWALLRKKVM